jgi:hypothetical protein
MKPKRQMPHIDPLVLWEQYQKPETLVESLMAHLRDCQDCIAILIMCEACSSLEEAKARLRAHGVHID